MRSFLAIRQYISNKLFIGHWRKHWSLYAHVGSGGRSNRCFHPIQTHTWSADMVNMLHSCNCAQILFHNYNKNNKHCVGKMDESSNTIVLIDSSGDVWLVGGVDFNCPMVRLCLFAKIRNVEHLRIPLWQCHKFAFNWRHWGCAHEVPHI